MNKQCTACGRYKHDLSKELCSICDWDRETKSQSAYVKDTVYIDGYGNESVKRIDELSRRTILPDKKKGGGYYLGRRGENGKIADRWPSY